MKNILIAGGAGFIGSNLALSLLKSENRVICMDNFYTGSYQNLEKFKNNKNFELIEHDISYSLLDKFNFDVDEIYNLACPASPPHYQKDPIQTFKTSVFGNYNLLEYARKHSAKFLFTSTSEVYGNPLEHPQKETYWGNVNPIGIRSCYDEGKRASETLIVDYQKKYNLNTKIVRIFNTYGVNMDPDDGRVVSNFIVQALRNKDITIYGSGTQTRSFCYVDDLVRGLILMMNSGDDFSGPVNLGNPNEIPVSKLAQIVIDMTKSKSKIIYMDLPQDDPIKRRPDITLAKEKLNWQPEVDLELGLRKTIEYFSQKIRSAQ